MGQRPKVLSGYVLAMPDEVPALPIADVLGGLSIPALPDGATPTELFALIKYKDVDGGEAFVARVTANFDEDEQLGVLVSYVEYMKQVSAATWMDGGATKPQ